MRLLYRTRHSDQRGDTTHDEHNTRAPLENKVSVSEDMKRLVAKTAKYVISDFISIEA